MQGVSGKRGEKGELRGLGSHDPRALKSCHEDEGRANAVQDELDASDGQMWHTREGNRTAEGLAGEARD